MKITVITVCLNSAKTIQNTLHSITMQNHPNVEHIIIDGGSTDDTLKKVYLYQSQNTKVISESDNGIYDAMNKGLLLATGDIITFLNADDAYVSNEIFSQVASLMEKKQIDAVFGDVEFFKPDPYHIIRHYSSAKFTPKRVAFGWMPAHPTLFLRKKVINTVGLFRTDYRIAGDFEYIARVFWPNTFRYHYLPQVMVRMQAGGISTGGWRNTLLLNREILRACRENNIPTNVFKILSKYPQKLIEFKFMNMLAEAVIKYVVPNWLLLQLKYWMKKQSTI